MATTAGILQASIGGSVELLTVSGAGAVLAALGHFPGEVSSNISKGMLSDSCGSNSGVLYNSSCTDSILTPQSFKLIAQLLFLSSPLQTLYSMSCVRVRARHNLNCCKTSRLYRWKLFRAARAMGANCLGTHCICNQLDAGPSFDKNHCQG